MDIRFFATPAEFRAWLEQHHATVAELRVGFCKKAPGRPSLTWPESVNEALCWTTYEAAASPAPNGRLKRSQP